MEGAGDDDDDDELRGEDASLVEGVVKIAFMIAWLSSTRGVISTAASFGIDATEKIINIQETTKIEIINSLSYGCILVLSAHGVTVRHTANDITSRSRTKHA